MILNFIRPGHVSVHSFRKGPATEVSTSPESSLPSKHPWRCLPIFTNDELLGHLKSIVTTEPTKGVLEKPTGLARNTTLIIIIANN